MISQQQSSVSAQKRPASFALRPVSRAGPVVVPKCWEKIQGLHVMEQKQIPRPLIANIATSHWGPSSSSRGVRLIGSELEIQSASSSSLQHPYWTSFTLQGPNTNTLQPVQHQAVCPFHSQPKTAAAEGSHDRLPTRVSVRPWALEGQAQARRFSARVKDWLGPWPCPGEQAIFPVSPMPQAVTMLGFVVPPGLWCSAKLSHNPHISWVSFSMISYNYEVGRVVDEDRWKNQREWL